MSQPEPLSQASPKGGGSVWTEAPGLRNAGVLAVALTAATAGLSALAVSQPHATMVPAASTACQMRLSTQPIPPGDGIITGFDPVGADAARVQAAEARLQGQIDPAYWSNVRVIIRLKDGRTTAAALPDGLHVEVGDEVTVQGIFRNPSLPCHWVPALVINDIGAPTSRKANG